jgi:hypothetical protein
MHCPDIESIKKLLVLNRFVLEENIKNLNSLKNESIHLTIELLVKLIWE